MLGSISQGARLQATQNLSLNNRADSYSRSQLIEKFGEDTINILTKPDGSIDKSHIRELFRVDGIPPIQDLVKSKSKGSIGDQLIKHSQNTSSELNHFKEHLAKVGQGGISSNSAFSLDMFG